MIYIMQEYAENETECGKVRALEAGKDGVRGIVSENSMAV